MPDETLIKIFRAIAISDCSSGSADQVFTHRQITDFAALLITIFPASNIFSITKQSDILLMNCYLNLLSQTEIGAKARSAIAVAILQILSPRQREELKQIQPAKIK